MSWELHNDRPIYLQLVEEIKRRITIGEYSPGDKLPAVRELAMEAGVNPNTMQKAMAQLEQEGLVFSQRTSGRFITEDMDMIDKGREQLIEEQMREFLKKMFQLGLDGSQILDSIKKLIKEVK